MERRLEDEIFCVISNPQTNECMRLGEVEREIFDLLDGTRDLSEVAAAFEERTGSAIDPPDLADFVDGLRQAGLVETTVFDPAQILEEFRERERAGFAQKQVVSGTVTMLRFLPFNADRFLGRLAGAIPWCWSRSSFILGSTLMVVGTGAMIAWLDRLAPAYLDLVQGAMQGGAGAVAGRVALLYILSGITVVIHELAHGLTLKHFGGPVPEMGFVLVYFQFPGAYTDTTASYLLPNRFQRVAVSMAGGYIEMVIAAGAVFVWWATTPGTLVNEIALMLIILGGPLTLLFNWNPLVPFDGYYMATDILEAPNLLPRSYGYVGDLIRQKIFRVPPVHPCPPVRLRRAYTIFGSLAWLYQALWLAVIPYAAFLLFSALVGRWIGGLLATVVTLHFARHPVGTLSKFIQYVIHERRGAGMEWPFLLRAGSVGAGVVGLAALFVPACPVHIHSTAFLEAEERFEVRADEPGFVREILVGDGERVAPGQPLVRLEDPDLAARVGTVRLERERARAAMLRDEALGDAASAAQWRTAWERLGDEYEIVRRRHDSLTLRSPGTGIVIAPRLEDRLGTRLRRGDLWCELARSDRLRAYVEVRETDLSDVFEGARVVALSSGYPTRRFVGRVARVPKQGARPPRSPGR